MQDRKASRLASVAALLLTLVAATAARAGAQEEAVVVPYVPTRMDVVEAMLSLGRVSGSDLLYDLGSGDGRIPITAAHRYGTRGVGYELIPWLVEHSYENADSAGVRHLVEFRAEDLFRADLTKPSVVTLFLLPEVNLMLRPRLLRDLRPGSRVVSNTFHMGDWQPDSTVTLSQGAARTTIYLWVIPADVDGFWNLRVDRGPAYTLEFRQQYQRLGGSATRPEDALEVTFGRLDAHRLEFTLEAPSGATPQRLRFSGRLENGELHGTVTGPPGFGTRRWRATRFSAAAPPE
jgi:hypothetical protein